MASELFPLMRRCTVALAIGVATLAAQTQAPDPSGIWRVNGIGPGLPWTVVLKKTDGAGLTGYVRPCASEQDASEIVDGTLEGKTIRFKCTSRDGDRTITLTGTIDGESIEFTWQKVVRPGGLPFPRDLMFGATAPARFTAKRASTATREPPSRKAAEFQALLDKKDYPAFAFHFPVTSALKAEEANYFSGIHAYLDGRFADVRAPLVSAVNTIGYSLTPAQVAQALETLGDVAMKTFRYQEAIGRYELVDQVFSGSLEGVAYRVRQKLAVARALENAPPQTIEIAGNFSVKANGLLYPITVGGNEFTAALDSGAAFSIVTESTAKAWGVKPMTEAVTALGSGGGEFRARPAVVPVLQIGKAQLRNVVVLVIDDPGVLGIGAMLGYPVISALGRLTFEKDHTLTVSTTSPDASIDDAPMWVSYSFPLVSLDTAAVRSGELGPSGTLRTFVLDTLGMTYLTGNYLAEHRAVFSGPPPDQARFVGLGGAKNVPAYTAKDVPLWFGPAKVLLNGPHVLAASQGGEIEQYFGLIGFDQLFQLSSYTFDFRTMHVTIKP